MNRLLSLLPCIVWVLLAQISIASDVYIKTDDNEFGQGIIRPRGSECMIITPLHVVDNAFKIEVTLADKRRYSAELVESFPGDVGVLRMLQSDSPACTRNRLLSDNQLDVLLDTEKQGELRTMLADGSIRIIPVNIVGYDKFRHVHVAPQDTSAVFSKGESGSPLYVAGHFAGMLLSVTNNVGTILRSDTLSQTVSLFFAEKPGEKQQATAAKKPVPVEDRTAKRQPAAPEHSFSGFIAKSAVVEHTVKLEGNSPVRLHFNPTGDKVTFNIEVLDSARRIVFQNKKNTLSGSDAIALPFTPPTTDHYSIFLIGTQGEGKYAFSIAPITSDGQLRNAANAVQVGGHPVQGILAFGAVAEYRVQLEGNSPVRLQLPATDDPLRYSVDIVDLKGKSVFRDTGKQYSTENPVAIPFTPPNTGSYLIRLKGTDGEGKYALQLVPITSNARLRGDLNVLELGQPAVEGVIAQGAVATYRIALQALRPVRFAFAGAEDAGSGQFSLEIVDASGVAVYVNPTRRYGGTDSFAIPFTAPKDSVYTLRILGIEGECRFSLAVLEGGKR